MAVIALTSARGAPGVTTTALALALVWPRPCLLLEADVAGSSSILAGYLRGSVRHDKGLVDLALAHRRGGLVDGLQRASIPLLGSQARLVAGLTGPAQAPTLQPVWEPIAAVLHGLGRTGTDVIIDAGRVGAVGGPAALLRQADITLLTTRSTLPAIAATRARATALRDDLANHGTGEDALCLLVVGEGQPYSGNEIGDAVGVPVAARIAWDPVSAEVFSLGAGQGRRFESSGLVRSAHAAVSALAERATRRRDRLAPDQLVEQAGVNRG
jgi:hypothetical protein